MASDLRWYPPEEHSDPAYRAQWALTAEQVAQQTPVQSSLAPPPATSTHSLYPASPPTSAGIDPTTVQPTLGTTLPVATPPMAPVTSPPEQWPASNTGAAIDAPFDKNRIVAIAVFTAAALLITGAFLPWVNVTGELGGGDQFEGGLTGWQRLDGVATVAIAIAIAGLAGLIFVGWRSLVSKAALVAAGVAAIVIAIVESFNLAGEERASDNSGFDVDFTIGLGIWVTAGAGALLILLALFERTKVR